MAISLSLHPCDSRYFFASVDQASPCLLHVFAAPSLIAPHQFLSLSPPHPPPLPSFFSSCPILPRQKNELTGFVRAIKRVISDGRARPLPRCPTNLVPLTAFREGTTVSLFDISEVLLPLLLLLLAPRAYEIVAIREHLNHPRASACNGSA